MKSQNLHFAFDVGHSSIGWAVLETLSPDDPRLLGCGSVIFRADDCLASERRGFRRQRRHIRATRLRIARLRRLLAHVGFLPDDQLAEPGCAWPWLLAARVLRGGAALTAKELWDVLRWYAHNRGYDGNKGWSRHEVASAEDTEKEKRAGELLTAFAAKHGRAGTMAEVFCDVLGLDPLGEVRASTVRMRNLGAAFPREGVEAEVERILRAHVGILPAVDGKVMEAILRDHTAAPGVELRLPARYGQRLAGGELSPGGVLFGQLVPRFDNRIIARCPITFESVYQAERAQGSSEDVAAHEAEKRAKVPGVNCVEFHRYRWAMVLANIKVATDDPRAPRGLSVAERVAVNAEMERRGYFTAGELKKAVRAQTGGGTDNLEQLLSHDDAERALVLDPVRRFAQTNAIVSALWPALPEPARRRLLGKWRRGKRLTVAEVIETAGEGRATVEAAAEKCFDAQSLKKRRKDEPLTREAFLRTPLQAPPLNGRAPHTREVMAATHRYVLATDRHPAEEGGPLFRSEAIRQAQLQRALDEQTNNHLVRHRLKILERLHEDLIAHYAGGERNRVARITIEVNRDLRAMSGKTAQEQAKEQGQMLAHFKGVQKKLEAAYEGLGVHVGPGLIRKGRIAEDLGWTCPYTGANYDALDLLHRRVDKDHIIPRSERPSDSLDSLVITFAEINKWKGKRTAVRFVEEEQGKPVPGLPNVFIKTLSSYLRDVEALETFKGHDDDKKRKRNRKRLLLLRDYVEKEFTPRDLTQTSQLVRLGAQALERHYAAGTKPVITSLPGSVTGAVRKSWNLMGCLATANPGVLNPDDLDDAGHPKVRNKTEIRGITHLHHALDACVLAFAAIFLPRDGGAWELLTKRRLNAEEQRRAREKFRANVEISSEGQLRLPDLAPALKETVRFRLAERRVVQHIPAEMAGLPTKETVWRIFDPADDHPSAQRLAQWLRRAKVKVPEPTDSTVIITRRKRKDAANDPDTGGRVLHEGKVWRWVFDEVEKSKVLGYAGGENGKLAAIKGGKLIADNYGMALLPGAPKGERPYRIIRFFRVWEQIEKSRAVNGGRRPTILRRGQLITFSTGKLAGEVFRVIGINENGLIRFARTDVVRRIDKPMNYRATQITSLMKDGIVVLKGPLCGASALP